jgi:hypothetical protein
MVSSGEKSYQISWIFFKFEIRDAESMVIYAEFSWK